MIILTDQFQQIRCRVWTDLQTTTLKMFLNNLRLQKKNLGSCYLMLELMAKICMAQNGKQSRFLKTKI